MGDTKADALWRRFAGIFGGESLARKYGDEPPREWVEMCWRLNDFQLERGLRRVVYSGLRAPPSLPEFVRLCRDSGGVGEIDEGPRETLAQLAAPVWDPWLLEGNKHLLNYILRNIAISKRYAPDSRYVPSLRSAKSGPLSIGPPNHKMTGFLVAAKNAWVRDMQEAAGDGSIPEDAGRGWWEAAMREAEERIYLANKAVA